MRDVARSGQLLVRSLRTEHGAHARRSHGLLAPSERIHGRTTNAQRSGATVSAVTVHTFASPRRSARGLGPFPAEPRPAHSPVCRPARGRRRQSFWRSSISTVAGIPLLVPIHSLGA